MRKPKANAQSVVQKWADELREAANDLMAQAKAMDRAADVLETKYLPNAGVMGALVEEKPVKRRDRDGESVVH